MVSDIRTGHPSRVVAPVSGLSALIVTPPLHSPSSDGNWADGVSLGVDGGVGEIGVVAPPQPDNAIATIRAGKALQYIADLAHRDALRVPGHQHRDEFRARRRAAVLR